MSTPHYYIYPFGDMADDKEAIPDSSAVDGSVSYQDGWTPPYELNLLTDPAALPIPRGQMNQLLYDITLNIQEYQQYGTPQWVDNTVQYPIYARVYYSGQVYENQVSNNTVTPGIDASWNVISGNVGGIPVGTIIDFAGPVLPTDFLECDGSQRNRTTFATLLAAISQIQNGHTTNTLNTLTGLSDTSEMYIGMEIEGTGIPSNTTVLNITSSTSITMSSNATATGTVSVKFFWWGNGNGSTTFNLPDFRRRTSMGAGGTGTTVIGNSIGQNGGEEDHKVVISEIPNHFHNISAVFGNSSPGSISNSSANVGGLVVDTGNIDGYTSQTNLDLYQPTNVVKKCIKYQ